MEQKPFQVALAALAIALFATPAMHGQSMEWTRLLVKNSALDVSADAAGNVFMGGVALPTIVGALIPDDGFVAKYNSSGQLSWNKRITTSQPDWVTGVLADGQGGVYASGWTMGSLARTNNSAPPHPDALFMKYDSTGTQSWIRQWGTDENGEWGQGLGTDGAGNFFMGGDVATYPNPPGEDEFLNQYSATGNLIASHRNPTDRFEFVWRTAADPLGNVFLTGRIQNQITGSAGSNIYVSKYRADGSFQWLREFSTPTSDWGLGVAADGLGNVYVSGYTLSSIASPNAGGNDAIVAKYDTDGNLLWSKQYGTSGADEARGVWADSHGNVYVTGPTTGTLGAANLGDDDAYVRKFSAATGDILWTKQFGTNKWDYPYGISSDGMGNIYVTGTTTGNLGGASSGGQDAFLAKIVDPMRWGDFNYDGHVDAADYTTWRNGLGTQYTMANYTAWKTNYGLTIPTGGAAAVPEPGFCVLFAGAIAVLVAGRPAKFGCQAGHQSARIDRPSRQPTRSEALRCVASAPAVVSV